MAVFRPGEWYFIVQFLSQYLIQRCDEYSRALVDVQQPLCSLLENAPNPGGVSAEPRWGDLLQAYATTSRYVFAIGWCCKCGEPWWGLVQRKPFAGKVASPNAPNPGGGGD